MASVHSLVSPPMLLVILLSLSLQSKGKVTITSTGTHVCSEFEASFMCSGGGPTPFLWVTGGLASQNIPFDFPQSTRNLSNSTTTYSRYTSTTPTDDANPAQLTIRSLTESEDGATVLCLNSAKPLNFIVYSNVLFLRIGPPKNCGTFYPRLVGDPGCYSFNVSWDTPTCTNGWISSSRDSYIIDPMPSGSSIERHSSTLFTLSGLCPNVSYTFRVVLMNCGSRGDQSGIASATTDNNCNAASNPISAVPFKISAAPDCSIPVAAGVSAAVVVIVSVVSSLITFCITYLIMRKKGQASPVYKVLDNVE